MFLGILAALALTVGSIEASNDIEEANRLAAEQANPAVVQVIELQRSPGFEDPDMGL